LWQDIVKPEQMWGRLLTEKKMAHECIKEAEWGAIETMVKGLKDSYDEHRKGAWMRVGIAGIIGGFIGTGAGEFIIRVIGIVCGITK